MDSEWFLEQNQRLKRLVLAVYRVANVLNKQKEGVLASELKKQSNQVLRSFIETRIETRRGVSKNNQLFLQIEVLQNFFDLGREFHLVNDKNFIVLNKAFENFKNDVLEEINSGSGIANNKQDVVTVGTRRRLVPTKKQSPVTPVLNKRQTKLISVVKKKNEISISDVSDIFKGQVSDKTIRRDLIDLMNKGLIGRKGDKRWTKYYLR